MEGDKEVCTLRKVVNSDELCAKKFDQVYKLAQSIFTRDDTIPLPYFTPHDASHCEGVEKNLNHIIWGSEKTTENDFLPSPEEATYLLSGVLLHDIGMWFGIFENEKDSTDLMNPAKVMELRHEHEIRAVRYIRDVWKLESNHWSDQDKNFLTNIIGFHRRHYPINTFGPATVASRRDRKPIRLVVLAALLRLADACHEDLSRAPGFLMKLYKSVGMPAEATCHWERAKLITAVDFDHTSRNIIITGQCPSKFEYPAGEFNLGEIVEMVCHDIQEELWSVQQVLLQYHNAYFGEVKRVIHPLFGADYGEGEQYIALWPLLLDRPSGSTEAAAALAQMLLFAVKKGERKNDLGETWQENSVFPIIEKTQESRPADFMIRNLCQGVKDRLSRLPRDAKSARELTEYLEGFLVGIKQNCQKIADIAPDFVGLNDILVVHGYCKNIAAFLERLSGRGNNALYIVIYDEFSEREKVGPEENERISSFAERLGFREVIYLTLSAFAEVLNNLGGTPCKVLLGTHGVLKDRELRCTEFLCKVGSYTLALVAQQAKKRGVKVRVVVFAEKMKFLTNGESDEKVGRHEAFFSTLEHRRDTQSLRKLYALPKIDFVSKDFVDDVFTEDGVIAVSDLRASGE